MSVNLQQVKSKSYVGLSAYPGVVCALGEVWAVGGWLLA